MLPPGFTSRRIGVAGMPVGGTGYLLPIFPDGSATFRTNDGGWVLATNAESIAAAGSGASAIRFNKAGAITDAYRILGNTNFNCAGGPTPWGTWLSGEESDDGMIWECDPAGRLAAEPRPMMGAVPARGRRRRPRPRSPVSDRGRPDRLLLPLHPGRLPVARHGPARGGGRGPGRQGHVEGDPRPDHGRDRDPDPGPGRGCDPLHGRRGPLVRAGRLSLHDQGRQEGLGLRHEDPEGGGHLRRGAGPRRLAQRRGQRHGQRARRRASSARTAATARSA